MRRSHIEWRQTSTVKGSGWFEELKDGSGRSGAVWREEAWDDWQWGPDTRGLTSQVNNFVYYTKCSRGTIEGFWGVTYPVFFFKKKKVLCGEWIEEGKNWKLGNNILVLYSSSLILNAFAHLHFIENKQKNLIPVLFCNRFLLMIQWPPFHVSKYGFSWCVLMGKTSNGTMRNEVPLFVVTSW